MPRDEQRLAVRNRPNQSTVMYQTWEHLLFLHWEIDPALIQATLPAGLTVDTFDGKAYLGIVPFYMNWIRPKFLPPVPKLSFFLETNLRTYVYDQNGVPGVWFYSLDCNQPLAVWIARTFFKLPYFHAKMTARRDGEAVDYLTQRRGVEAQGKFVYRPISEPKSAEIGTLEFFLGERYVLFANTKQGLKSGRVWHTPYQLSSAEVSHYTAELIALAGFPAITHPFDNALYSAGVRVNVFPLR